MLKQNKGMQNTYKSILGFGIMIGLIFFPLKSFRHKRAIKIQDPPYQTKMLPASVNAPWSDTSAND